MEYCRRIKEFIIKDVENANETKRASVIMRMFSLVMCAYFLIQGIFMIVFGEWSGVIVSSICLLGYIGAFYSTYLNHTRMALLYTVFSTIFWVLLYIFLFGWDCGAQHFLFVLLIFFFVVSHAGTGRKIGMAAVLCAIRLALFGYTRVYTPVIWLDPMTTFVMQIFNSISIFVLITVIIMLFCQDSLTMEKKLVLYNDRLKEASLRDPLTKLYNRRAMLEYMNGLIAKIDRHGSWFNVAIGDIDFFKKVNDTYGHEAGDMVLVQIAGLLSGYMKGWGRAGRWGGEEFLLVFEGINGEEAFLELEKLRSLIGKQKIAYNGHIISVTMTFGLDEYSSNAPLDYTINSADQKLYMGKNQGRNRVIF